MPLAPPRAALLVADGTILRLEPGPLLGMSAPESHRLPVLLSDALDLPASEIAGILGLSLPAVKARLLRGRRRLRAEIERYCQDAGLSGWRELVKD